jgi:adenylate kinase family enzyme
MDRYLLLLHGKPGAGKSTAAATAIPEIEGNLFPKVEHFSVGGHMRSILYDSRPSVYAERLAKEAAALGASKQVDNDLVNGIVGEYLAGTNPKSLTIIDGYPLYTDQISPFQETTKQLGLNTLGLVEITIPDEVAIERMLGRGTRQGEIAASVEFAQSRVDEYNEINRLAVNALSRVVPYLALNGLGSTAETAQMFYDSVEDLFRSHSRELTDDIS